MNNKIRTTVLLFFICMGLQAQQITPNMDKYTLKWQEVEKLENDDLPRSSLDIVETILKQSIADKNTPQAIKSLIYKTKYNSIIDNDTNVEIFGSLENLLEGTSEIADKSVLHSILGELYLKYYQNKRWEIDSRTNMADFIPSDIKEWSANIFTDKITYHFSKAVESRNILEKVNVNVYDEILIQGKDSKLYYPTLYDFLMKRNIELSQQLYYGDLNGILSKSGLQIKDLAVNSEKFIKIDLGKYPASNLFTLQSFQQYLTSLSQRKMYSTLILTELDRNNYLSNRSETYKKTYTLSFLEDLQKRYTNNATSIFILNDLANYYTQQSRQYRYAPIAGDNQNADNLKKAYDWYLYGINKFPNNENIYVLKSKLEDMEAPRAQLQFERTYYPKQSKKDLTLEYTNLKKIYIKVYNTKDNSLVKEITQDLKHENTYQGETQKIDLNINELGNYNLEISFDKEIENKIENPIVSITRLMVLARLKAENEYEFYVVDRETGHPIKDATVNVTENDKSIKSLNTDDKGFVQYKSEKDLNNYSIRNNFEFTASKNNDSPSIVYKFPFEYRFDEYQDKNENQKVVEKINIFTDRNIYRPGQTVFFKAIAFNTNPDNSFSVISNRKYTVKLFDVNGQIVSEKNITTNDFGSIAGEFVLPKSKLTGQYHINIENENVYLNVEEYKRPTFQVSFDKITRTYNFGEKVTITGHAENFSGIKLQNAEVEYSISKSSWWRWTGDDLFIESNIVQTNDDGTFQITFTIPEDDSKDMLYWRNISSFSIDANVTDQNGETQSGNFSFVVGKVSMILNAQLSDKVDKANIKDIIFSASNLNGESIETSGSYSILKIGSDSIKKEVLKGNFSTGKQENLAKQLKSLESGKYQLILKAKDSNGLDVESEQEFILFSFEDKRPPIDTDEWFVVKNKTFSKSQNAEFILGLSNKETTVLYELIKDYKILDRQQINISDKNHKFVIPYKEVYGDRVYATYTYVVDGVIHKRILLINEEKEQQNLTLKLDVFRDKLRPGDNEEWKISVKDNNNKPVFAELLASMYDSSLDKIYLSQSWDINTYIYRSSNTPRTFAENLKYYNNSIYFNFPRKNIQYQSMSFDQINWFDFDFSNTMFMSRRMKATAAPNAVMSENAVDVADLQENKVVALEASAGLGNTSGIEKDKNNEVVQIRSNFNETAFFYPQLKTDANGETTISFTVPESNTTWKFRALAYDKALVSGGLQEMVVSRKELMVTPNIPRFLRQGDKAYISTKISNLSEKDLSGKVFIEFFNPITDEILNIDIPQIEQTFTLAKEASSSAEWAFVVPSNIDMIGCRIIAKSENFSDGEQHALTVLPNRMLVTESLTMNVNGNQSKDFIFEKLVNNKSQSLSNYRLTLEYSSNPAWYAVQALPVLSNPTNQNAVNWFASYYANTLGTFITKQYPNVSRMIEAWQKQGDSKESLISKLEKNEELKTALLEETPWVLDAKNETEQMQRLSLLLDLNNNKQQTNSAVAKLKDLQNIDGGWSWYKDFASSRSITQYILYGFTELVELNAVEYPQEVKEMQMSAIKYIDSMILKDYKDLLKHTPKKDLTTISTNQLEYLFVRSAYRDIPIDIETRDAERFYTTVVEKNWNKLNLYERALLTIISKRNGNNNLSSQLMKSLRERASTNEEMGMFWANNTNSVFMSQSSVVTHTFLMNAFKETNASKTEMDNMKLWLLKQKQTQVWESTHATIDAIYALLSTGSDWFSNDSNVSIKVADESINISNKELGTGYIKQTWDKKDISNQKGNVSISKTGNGPSFGAMYWQYFEDLNKISKQKGELNIDKKLFIERTSNDGGKRLEQITENNLLKVGDKIVVRLTIRADRDLEFVELKDLRASCLEPIETISGNKWQNGLTYYQSTLDASTNYFFDNLPKGTYVLEYAVYANRKGMYSNGITSIQCLYAPEFISHTNGINITVE